MNALVTTPCPDCGAAVDVHHADAALGFAGPITVKCRSCCYELELPVEATARTRILALRQIVRDHDCARVDGYLVDVQTANLLVAVYDALSQAHRERFGTVPLAKLVDLGWRVAR